MKKYKIGDVVLVPVRITTVVNSQVFTTELADDSSEESKQKITIYLEDIQEVQVPKRDDYLENLWKNTLAQFDLNFN